MKQSTKRSKRHGKYDPVIKREIGRRYLANEFSYRVAAEEYGLPSSDTAKEFVRWYRRELALAAQPDGAEDNDQGATAIDGPSQNCADEIRQLRLKLRKAEQRAEAWKAMIDVAGEELNIDIVKKPAPKPSRD